MKKRLAVYTKVLQRITETETLIIDVRYNNGGTGFCIFRSPYILLEEGKGYDTLDLQGWNGNSHTEGNVRNQRLKDFETWLQQENISPDTVKSSLKIFAITTQKSRERLRFGIRMIRDELFPGVKGGSLSRANFCFVGYLLCIIRDTCQDDEEF